MRSWPKPMPAPTHSSAGPGSATCARRGFGADPLQRTRRNDEEPCRLAADHAPPMRDGAVVAERVAGAQDDVPPARQRKLDLPREDVVELPAFLVDVLLERG